MSRHAQQLRDHDINPCVAETDASRKCMDDNNYKKDMCTAYFLKYKSCRKFWHDVMMQRKRNGVKPEMPTAGERKYWNQSGSPTDQKLALIDCFHCTYEDLTAFL